jgi:hypothetical protein
LVDPPALIAAQRCACEGEERIGYQHRAARCARRTPADVALLRRGLCLWTLDAHRLLCTLREVRE